VTPARFLGTCAFCKLELDTREVGIHQYVKGWVMNREGGGGHGVSLPERENRWAHRHCVDAQTAGTFGQASLLDEPRVTSAGKTPAPSNASFVGSMLVHCCNVCGADAPFGIGVSRTSLGRWYCRDHRPTVEAT
jgi:hypothetical protein